MNHPLEGDKPLDNVPSPERPGGHIRVNVSQPELLYQVAKEVVRKPGTFNVTISQSGIGDQLLSGQKTWLFRYTTLPKSYSYSYQTDLRLDSNQNRYYPPERANQVANNLRMQGVAATTDQFFSHSRLKIYSPDGNYGVEIILGYSSKEVAIQRITEASTNIILASTHKKSIDELTEDEKVTLQKEIQDQLVRCHGSSVRLVNRKRLEMSDRWDTHPVVPPSQAEFLQQTEFYRRTLEQVLRALYDEAGVIPNVDITLRPPNVSGDTLDQIASITGETVRPITEQQLRPDRVTLDDIKGQPEAVREARRLVRAINQPELYQRRGMKPPKGILFVGPPGTGKTMLAKGIATEANADFVSINAANIGSKWINESAQLMNAVFDDAEKRVDEGRKVIIFIDEIDAIASSRDTSRMHIEDIKVISILLQRLDGVMTKPGVTLLATTNREGAIDPAILRPGRIDKIIPVELPKQEGRKEIIQSYVDKAKAKADPQYKDSLFDPNIDLDAVVAQTDGLSGAELENLVNRALEVNMDLELEGQGWRPMTAEQLLQAISAVKTETEQKKRYIGFVQPR